MGGKVMKFASAVRGRGRSRRLVAVLIGTFLLSLAFAAPASASWKQASLGSATVRVGPLQVPYTVAFQGEWDEYKEQDAGQTWWVISKIQVKADMVNGSVCCNGAAATVPTKVEFLSPTGAVVMTINPLPAGSCWWDSLTSLDVYAWVCRTTDVQLLASSVNRIRFTARFFVPCCNTLWYTAPVVKTVYL
jgi:hypothetical protein